MVCKGELQFMKMRIAIIAAAVVCVVGLGGCRKGAVPNTAPETKVSTLAGPLAPEGFKAEVTAPTPPTKLRPGQVEIIAIKVKNTSGVIWWPRGGETTDRPDNTYYIAAGNRWFDKDGKRTSETEGHRGIDQVLRPGEAVEMTLQITAPKEPGEWTLDLDMVQEGVAWFGDKGSPTTKIKVTVVK